MRVLITAGPTREFFDTVRFISNPSSGKMGYAITAAAAERGHDVILVSGPVELIPPPGVTRVSVVSAEEMAIAASEAFERSDVAIMTAAVCDYRPTERLALKLQKQAQVRQIALEPTRDICAEFGASKGRRIVIGFAMEDHDHRAHAETKLRRKRCNAVVLNGPENVGSEQASVEILTEDGRWSEPVTGSKTDIARVVVALAERLCDAAKTA